MLTQAECFAGLGGFRAAAEQNHIATVWSCEIDPYARKGYAALWGEAPTEEDITKVVADSIPDFDILTGGFPCQSFSIAGVSKLGSLGREHGFADPTRGTLFFDLCRILDAKRPAAFVFENVKNLVSHDKGNTFATILEALTVRGYRVGYRVVDAAGWLPQHRERVYIVGFRDGQDPTAALWGMEKPVQVPDFGLDILQSEAPAKYTLTDGTWACLQRHKANSKAKGNGFGYGLIEQPYEGKVTRTLSHRYYKDGGEILLEQPGRNPRRLTPRECMRLMGFSDDRTFRNERKLVENSGLSDCRLYMGLGNAIAVPPMAELLRKVKGLLAE